MTKLKFLLLLIFLGNFNSLLSQSDSVAVDTLQIELRTYSTETLEDLREKKEFLYDKKPVSKFSLSNWLSKLWEKLFGKKQKPQSQKAINTFIQILLYVLVLVVVVVIIYLLTGMRFRSLFMRNANSATMSYTVGDENIHEMNFDELILNAKNNGQFRLATRLWYLKSLKLLTNKNQIEWKANKTNREYYVEYGNKALKQHFADVIYLFENVWYGEFDIDAEIFEKVEATYQSFYEKAGQ